MSMGKEWQELKGYVSGLYGEKATIKVIDILRFMEDLERRSLPERVAKLLDNLSHTKMIASNVLSPGADIVHFTNKLISKALRTGDTTELEKWQE